ncbi:hypothetical protein NDU88_011605, partial [Pleurodeles waltl]
PPLRQDPLCTLCQLPLRQPPLCPLRQPPLCPLCQTSLCTLCQPLSALRAGRSQAPVPSVTLGRLSPAEEAAAASEVLP